jgi:hypothetical protein
MSRLTLSTSPANESSARTQVNRPVESLALFAGLFSLFSVLTAVFFWQWIPHLHSVLLGPPEDNMQDFWNTWYAAVATKPVGFFFTDLIRFPEGTPLYYHGFAYPKVFAVALLSKVVGTETTSLIFLHNISLLISFPLAGVGAFYLVRYLTTNAAGALLGAFVFAFNPSHVEHAMHHANVSSIEFIPFFILSYLVTIERRNLLLLLLTIVLYALNALSSWYYLFYLAYFIAFHTVYIAIRDRALPRGWQLFTPVVCLAGVVAALSPILVPMVRAAMGNASVYEQGHTYVADVFAYLAFPPYHLLGSMAHGIYQRLLRANNEWEATVYLGLVNVAVLAWLCLTAEHKDASLLKYVLCGMGVFCIFASGDWLRVLGHDIILMPDAVLSRLPFFANVRTPSRAIVFVYLFLAIGVGHAAGVAMQHRQRPKARWGVAAVAVAIVLDFFPARGFAMNPDLIIDGNPVACSPGLALIRDDPEKGFGVLDLPHLPNGKLATFETTFETYVEGNFYMLQQAACHGRPIVMGNTSRDVVVSLRDRLETGDLQAQRRQLAAARVKYIVMRLDFPWYPENGPRDRYPLIYQVVYNGVFERGDERLIVLRVY